ncbi:DUF932 domain-containing protein [Gordonia phosphorivorans]|uniref:DUF932 domain-containing protein n=1 Tax=Gordonia phosphorivorans TaxID=1056982 RepID=A0ABV6H6L2_9ACTN
MNVLAPTRIDPDTRRRPEFILGTDTRGQTDLDGVLAAAGLNWGLRTVSGSDGLSVIVDDREISTFAPERQLVLRDDNNVVLGMVGDGYQAVPNDEAFASTAIAAKMGAQYQSAGSSDYGRKAFVTMTLPEAEVRVGGKDVVSFSLLFSTDHSGGGAVAGRIQGVRQWCTNGATVPLREQMSWSVRHTATASERLAMVEDTVRGCLRYAKEFAALGEQLICAPMSKSDYETYINALFPRPDANAAPAAHTRYERRHADLMGLFHTAAIQQDSPESAWSAVAAVTEYEQWFRPARSELSRARRQLDGDSPRFTARAVTLAREMVGV